MLLLPGAQDPPKTVHYTSLLSVLVPLSERISKPCYGVPLLVAPVLLGAGSLHDASKWPGWWSGRKRQHEQRSCGRSW
jgi:hypothetical protein